MKQRNAPQLLARIGNVFNLLPAFGNRFFHVAIEDRMEDFFFAFEVKIDSAIGDSGFARDVGDFGIEVAIVGKDTNSGTQNGAALVGNGWTNRRKRASSAHK